MNFEKVNKVLDEVLDSSSDYENDDYFLDPNYVMNDNVSDGNSKWYICFESEEELKSSNINTKLNDTNIIEATDSDLSNDENSTPRFRNGKKRKVKTINWKRNIAKVRKNTGVIYSLILVLQNVQYVFTKV